MVERRSPSEIAGRPNGSDTWDAVQRRPAYLAIVSYGKELSNRKHAYAYVLPSNAYDRSTQKFEPRRNQNSIKDFDLLRRFVQLGRSQMHERRPRKARM